MDVFIVLSQGPSTFFGLIMLLKHLLKAYNEWVFTQLKNEKYELLEKDSLLCQVIQRILKFQCSKGFVVGVVVAKMSETITSHFWSKIWKAQAHI